MELLDSEPPQAETDDQSAWFSYVDKLVRPDGSVVGNKLRPNPLFLKRNRRKPATGDEVKREEVEITAVTQAAPAVAEEQESSSAVRYKNIAKLVVCNYYDTIFSAFTNKYFRENRIKEEKLEPEAPQGIMPCSFNPASYKMVYVCDGEDYLYRNRALLRAKEASAISFKSLTKCSLICLVEKS